MWATITNTVRPPSPRIEARARRVPCWAEPGPHVIAVTAHHLWDKTGHGAFALPLACGLANRTPLPAAGAV